LYRIRTHGEAQQQIKALPDDALASYAQVLGVLELGRVSKFWPVGIPLCRRVVDQIEEVSGRSIIDQEDQDTGDLVASVAVAGRLDLTDAQWAVLEPLLPVGKKPGRPPKWTRRQLIDGIRWRVRAGTPWRDVPPVYGSWQAVYALFRRWQRAGVWAAILARLQALADAAGLITWDVSVDSTIARAHQHAAGARKRGMRRRSRPAG
jgi:transposase